MRVGIDLVDVEDVADSVEQFGDRYVTRIYTEHEIACCRTGRDESGPIYAMESLAARFAAKEAVPKVLRPVEVQPAWRSIELHRTTGGWCEIRLSGPAAALAAEAGIEGLSVSLSHEPAIAAAVVVGWFTSKDRGDG
jgi:holo-[acyl-carrier protein] synthase